MHEAKKLTINEVMKRIEGEADSRRFAAQFNGSHTDNGAGELQNQIKWFQAGVMFAESGEIPSEWQKYQEVEDDEYAEYKRLRKKFEETE